jgi:hypothetical protein
MSEWGVAETATTKYLEQINIAFDSADGTDQEKIARQFWIAMYNRGFEGWTVYRLFDAPELKKIGYT